MVCLSYILTYILPCVYCLYISWYSTIVYPFIWYYCHILRHSLLIEYLAWTRYISPSHQPITSLQTYSKMSRVRPSVDMSDMCSFIAILTTLICLDLIMEQNQYFINTCLVRDVISSLSLLAKLWVPVLSTQSLDTCTTAYNAKIMLSTISITSPLTNTSSLPWGIVIYSIFIVESAIYDWSLDLHIIGTSPKLSNISVLFLTQTGSFVSSVVNSSTKSVSAYKSNRELF